MQFLGICSQGCPKTFMRNHDSSSAMCMPVGLPT
jgi:hypothetical protein